MAYAPNIDGTTVRTLGEWGQFFKDNGQPHDIIEAMDMENSILDDIKWKEASDSDGNRTAVRNGLPGVFWRQLYKGIPPSKSTVTMVKDPVGMLEGRSMIDKKLLDIHQSQAKAYRLQEIRAFGEAMRQELATALFYGDIKGNPLAINGLAPRYAYSNAPHVVSAGGVGSENTSMFGVVWGERDVMGIFPKDSKAGMSHEALSPYDAHDADGHAFRAVGDLLQWNVGLAVSDWRSAVRVCNIDVNNLMKKKGETGFIDFHRLTIIAKNKLSPEKRNRLIWYCNEEVMTALELQNSDAGYVQLKYGDLYRSTAIPFIHGAAVRQNDAILNTEAALVPLP